MRYQIAKTGLNQDKVLRHNDGALVIMQGERLTDEYRAVMQIPMTVKAKRGQAWDTTDTAQEAFAQRVVDALNAADVDGLPQDED